jgi:site-specific DNA-cytosine methylase
MEYQKHKFNFFPEISGEDFDNLKNSIADGFNEKLGTITVYQNSILDGWNRYRACKERNVKPVYSSFEGTEQQAFEFSIKANQDRRHLSKSQLAVIAIEAEPIWVLIQEQVESDRRLKQAATLEKTLAEKKERERVEALRKIEFIRAENERIEKQKILKERLAVEKDLTEKAKIEAERLWIEEVYERKKLKEAERKKSLAELIPPNSNVDSKLKSANENTTKLGNIFGVNGKYISDAKKLKETNLAEFEAIKRGEKTITQVKKEIKLQKDISEKATKEAKLLNDNKAIKDQLTTNVNPYDSNMFFVKETFNTSRFDDHIISRDDAKYPTLTTGTKLFDNNLIEFPLRFYSEVQTFPNDYKFCGPKTAIKTQIGNSVAPMMGKYISQFVDGKTVGDLFAGCGGFTCGFHQNNFTTDWAIEWDKNAANSFKLNFQDTIVYNSNIVGFDTSILSKVDVIIGGPPCKGFSTAGYGFKDDPRNLLYKEFWRVVNDLKPNQFIMENVLQVETISEQVIKDFTEIGYSIETKKVYGIDIGMKQNRKRFFFIGTKN